MTDFKDVCNRALQLVNSQVTVHARSEEHTSELQSPGDLVCRLLLENEFPSNVESRMLAIYYSRRRNLLLLLIPTLQILYFFNDTATPEIYTLTLHDALPI